MSKVKSKAKKATKVKTKSNILKASKTGAKKGPAFKIAISCCSVAAVGAGIGVGVYYAVKDKKDPEPAPVYHDVTIIQPEQDYSLKINGKTDKVSLQVGKTYTVEVTKTNPSTLIVPLNLILTPASGSKVTIKLILDETTGVYKNTFVFNCNSNASAEVEFSSSTLESNYYIKIDNKPWILDQNALFNPDTKLFNITNFEDQTQQQVNRDTFNLGDIYIGENISLIPSFFFNNFPAFNHNIIFNGSPSEIGDDFMIGCTEYQPESLTLPSSVKSVGKYFLALNTKFNGKINTDKIEIFGQGFLLGCTSFNQEIKLDSAQQIVTHFLTGCSSFDQDITFPSSINLLATPFLYQCDSFSKNGNRTITINTDEFQGDDISMSIYKDAGEDVPTNIINIAGSAKNRFLNEFNDMSITKAERGWHRKFNRA